MNNSYKTIREKIICCDKYRHKMASRLIYCLVLLLIISAIILSLADIRIIWVANTIAILAFIETGLSIIFMGYLQNHDGEGYHFICPNKSCLMTNFVGNMRYVCPMCNTDYNSEKYRWVNRKDVIFDKCFKCHRSVQWIECYECHQPIDLDALYDEKALEKLSNEV